MTINVPIQNAGLLYINGLNLVYASNTTLTVNAGQCRNSTNINDIVVSSAVTINAAVNGINGLDQGSLAASTVYAVYAMGDSTMNNAGGAMLSTSSSGPTAIPYGYDMWRLIGHVLTDGSSHILPFQQTGSGSTRIVTYDTLIQLLNAGNATAWADVACSSYAPAATVGRVYVQVALTPAAAGHEVFLRRKGSSSTLGSAALSGTVASVVSAGTLTVPVNSSAIFQYEVSNSSDAVSLYLSAYEDEL